MIQVMIVEDDPMVSRINSKFLERLDGFNLVNAVSNIKDAIVCMNNNQIDLILLDVYLPKESGMDLLKWLRSNEYKVDVILITADNTSKMVRDAFRYGVVDYLIKPFTFERFKESLVAYKTRKKKFEKIDVLEQDSIDKYMRLYSDNDCEKEYEKGINQYTYKIIANNLKKNPEEFKTAEEISDESGMARVTVRRYLEYMKTEGTIEMDIEYGKVGRPQHKYRII
ncbi:MAG: response regulator [Clostridiales bacterium]|nr:response regulator [Clostridiales bacterium]